MIELVDVHHGYELDKTTIPVIQGVSFTVTAKSQQSIVGPSGSGKSTLLRIMAGLEPPSQGQVLVSGQSIYQLTDAQRSQIRAQKFGFVFQSFRLFPGLNVIENIQLACDIKGMANAKEIAIEWANRVGVGHRLTHSADTLSGGEQQRVAIARALATQPSVIIADEPTGNLDAGNSDKIRQLFHVCLKETSTALVLVTHDSSLASMCPIQYQLHQGQLVAKTL
tara:strand:+ start:845 stop:1513 length:669 start_codon:yes stop_codon:yes gene_type:complete